MYIMCIYICNYIYISVCVPGISRTFPRKKIGNVKCFFASQTSAFHGSWAKTLSKKPPLYIYIYMIIYVYNYIYIVQYMYHLFEVYAKHFSIKNNGLWHWANSIGTWPAYFQGMKSAMWSWDTQMLPRLNPSRGSSRPRWSDTLQWNL